MYVYNIIIFLYACETVGRGSGGGGGQTRIFWLFS